MSSSPPDNPTPSITVTQSTPPLRTEDGPMSNLSDTFEQVETVKTIGQVETANTCAMPNEPVPHDTVSKQPKPTDNKNKKTLLARVMELEKTIVNLKHARFLLGGDIESNLRNQSRQLDAVSKELKAVKSLCTEHLEAVEKAKQVKQAKFVLWGQTADEGGWVGRASEMMAGASAATKGAGKRKHSELSVVEEDSKGEEAEEAVSAKYPKIEK